MVPQFSFAASCNGPTVIESAVQILHEALLAEMSTDMKLKSLVAEALRTDIKMTVRAIRTTSRDDRLRSVGCQGELHISFPPATSAEFAADSSAAAGMALLGFRLVGNSAVGDIKYSAQTTDDGKSVYVQVHRTKQTLMMMTMVAGTGLR